MMLRRRWWTHKLFAVLGNTPQKLGVSYGVSIAAGDATKTGDVLTDVVYTITVTNDGSAPDTFDIAKSGEVWGTVLSAATIGPIAAGGSDTFTATVSVPIDVADEATDGVTITVTSQASVITSDTEELTTTANQIYLVYDTFIDTNGTDLDAHAPEYDAVGDGYIEVIGDWEILGNVLPGPGTSGDVAVIDVGVADHYAEAELTPDTGAPGIITRYQDSTHFWVAFYNVGAGKIQLYINDGGFSKLDEITVTWNAGDRLRFTCSGNSLKIYHNDVEKLSITNATFNTATSVGIRQGLDGAESFDNFIAG